MKEFQVEVTEEQKKKLEEIGRRTGKTASEVLSDMLSRWLKLEAARLEISRKFEKLPPSHWLSESWPRILTLICLAVAGAAAYAERPRVKLVAVAAGIASILTDLFMSDWAVKSRRLTRELKATDKLSKDLPLLWDIAWRQKGPEAAEAELLQMLEAQRARMLAAARDLGLEDPPGRQKKN
jgi:hypothetical protein